MLCVSNQESVSEKQSIALIENSADYSDVKTLASFIDKMQRRPDWNKTVEIYDLPLGLSLGEILLEYS